MCDKTTKATHLIYSSGLPYYSTILAMLSRERLKEQLIPNPKVEKVFDVWKEVVDDPLNFNNEHRDSNLTLSSLSQNENEVLKRLKIPVLISYGTRDESFPYQDLFRIETIKERVDHITFKAYFGLNHTYQLEDKDFKSGKTDFLEDVVTDWKKWINLN